MRLRRLVLSEVGLIILLMPIVLVASASPAMAACSHDILFIGVHGMKQGPASNNPDLDESPEIVSTFEAFEDVAGKRGKSVNREILSYPARADFGQWQLLAAHNLIKDKNQGVSNLRKKVRWWTTGPCKDRGIVLVGYSLGAWVIDEYLDFTKHIYPNIRGVVLYGDPQFLYDKDGTTARGIARLYPGFGSDPYPPEGDNIADRWGSICFDKDPVCGLGYSDTEEGHDQQRSDATSCDEKKCNHVKYKEYGLTERYGKRLAEVVFGGVG